MLTKLSLANFRSYKESIFEFSPVLTIIVGPNASGKTNILEAISLLSTGTSFRAELAREMIRESEELMRIRGVVTDPESKRGEDLELEVMVTNGTVQGRKAPYKKMRINKLGRQTATFVGNLPTVLFWPEDLSIIIGSPSRRRSFLDRILTQSHHEYRRSVTQYEKALRVRNRLLKRIKEGETIDQEQLSYWEDVLIAAGTIISEKRRELLDFINTTKLPDDAEHFFSVTYDDSSISRQRLEKYYHEERMAGVTLVGPHRDNFIVYMKKSSSKTQDLAKYGSRGEQRLGVLWLKIAELSYLEQQIGRRPLLLLDDIFSELDQEHRALVTSLLSNQQTIMTTIDTQLVAQEQLRKTKTIKLST